MTSININTSSLDSVLANWQELPLTEKPIVVKSFSDGQNHHTHLISSGNQKAVLKLFTKPSPIAISAQTMAASHKLTPEIFYVNETKDVVLMEFIDNQTINHSLNKNDLTSLAISLKKLHSLPVSRHQNDFSDFDLLKHYDNYLGKLKANDLTAQTIHNELIPIVDVFLSDTTERCLCHNDLVPENCFVTGRGVNFIDWEYTQINNPWFDIATLIYSLKFDQQQVTQFFHDYDQHWKHKLNTRVYFSALICMLWCDILWHLARGQTLKSPSLKSKLFDLNKLKDQFNFLSQ